MGDDLFGKYVVSSISRMMNEYTSNVSEFPLCFTNKVFMIYFNKEKICLEDKLSIIEKYVCGFKTFFERRVRTEFPEGICDSVDKAIKCMNSHIKAIPCSDDYLIVELNYWQLISDLMSCEILLKKFYPKNYQYNKFIHRMIPLCFLEVNEINYEFGNSFEEGEEWKQ